MADQKNKKEAAATGMTSRFEEKGWDGIARRQDINSLPEGDLLILLGQIQRLLPARNLRDMDLAEELTLQYRAARALQERVLTTEGVPANQQAQVVNAVVASIQSLVKMQTEYYTAERLKRIENALVRMLNAWPREQTALFFEQYEKILAGE